MKDMIAPAGITMRNFKWSTLPKVNFQSSVAETNL